MRKKDKMSTKVTTEREVRLSYTNLLEPRAQDEEKPTELTYSTAMLIPKSDTATVELLKGAIGEALTEGIAKKWGGKKPGNLRNPLRDGDEKVTKDGDPDELYAGHWFINAKGPNGGKEAPFLFNKAGEPTKDSGVIYSGVFGRVSVQFFAYDKAGNRGVGAQIVAVMSGEHGDPLGNTVTASSALNDFGVSTPASAAAADFDTPDSGSASASDDDVWGS